MSNSNSVMNKERPLALLGCGGLGIVFGVLVLLLGLMTLYLTLGSDASNPRFLTEIGGEQNLGRFRALYLLLSLEGFFLLFGSVYSLMRNPLGLILMKTFGSIACLHGLGILVYVMMTGNEPETAGGDMFRGIRYIAVGLIAWYVYTRSDVKAYFD